MKPKKTQTTNTNNLIGENKFQQFLEIQTSYGYAQRGGAILKNQTTIQSKRLVNDVNILVSTELKKLVFNELIFGN
jgi:hypothetical protein